MIRADFPHGAAPPLSCCAPIEAALRADAALEAGDLDGLAVWKRIVRAVEELRGKAPEDGVRVH